MLQERVRLSGGWSLTIEWLSASARRLEDRVRTIAVWAPVADGERGWKGPPPPLMARPTAAQSVGDPGFNIDICWLVGSGPLGPFTWTQQFRDGLEVATPSLPAQLQIGLTVSYAEMLRLLYAAVPFEMALGADAVAARFSAYGCITGLVHGDRAQRPGVFDAGQLGALVEWATRGGHEQRSLTAPARPVSADGADRARGRQV